MSIDKHRSVRLGLVALLLAAVAVVAAGCGSDDKSTGSTMGGMPGMATGTAMDGSADKANGIDLAFVSQMVPHHRSAIDMATIATRRGQHPEIKSLATDIISAQKGEIVQLTAVKERLTAAGLKPGDMGMTDEEMGMSMSDSSLRTADPFDRAFIDAMRVHHRGAIAMAEMELKMGGDKESRMIAEAIIAAQKKEIADMTDWRKRWYGSGESGSTHMG